MNLLFVLTLVTEAAVIGASFCRRAVRANSGQMIKIWDDALMSADDTLEAGFSIWFSKFVHPFIHSMPIYIAPWQLDRVRRSSRRRAFADELMVLIYILTIS